MPPKGRGKYLGFVAHEIKNPLATALWSCDLLKRMEGAERSGERAEKMIDVSLRALRRMRRLIDDYFMLERLAEDGYELKRERISLKTLVDSALGALSEKDRIPTAGWALEVGEGELTGDLEMLKRAVRCAVEHMARAIPPPRITLASRQSEEGVELLIRADPPPPQIVPPEPEERQSGDPSGSVLGFALAARILAAQRGRFEERDGALAMIFGKAG